ncbi:MAG: magnesium and cobalt transport protein CorA, partial [Deltaproteobacteria bacterium]|nr:magnesium and cobalt transport protein CorA [Deltaproteobacteria bacterium]
MKKAIKKSGLSPGSLIFTGEKKLEAPRITVIAYSETSFRQTEIRSLDDLAFDRKPHGITWINVEGIHHVETIRKIGELFSLHPLILEDILNPNQRPKVEDYDNAFFAVVRMLRQNGEGKVVSEQQSLVLTRNAVISFQECCGDVFDPVRKRIADGLGQIRKMGADYLFYALLDAVVDEYFVLLEQMDDALEALQGNLVNAASKTLPLRLQQFHKDVIVLRKAIWPMRDMMANLLR